MNRIFTSFPANGRDLTLPTPGLGCPFLERVDRDSWFRKDASLEGAELGLEIGTVGLYRDRADSSDEIPDVWPDDRLVGGVWCSKSGPVWQISYPLNGFSPFPPSSPPWEPLEFEDAFGSSLVGWCPGDHPPEGVTRDRLEYDAYGILGNCFYRITNDVFAVQMKTTPYARPMIDWMEGDWIADLEEFFTVERLEAYQTVLFLDPPDSGRARDEDASEENLIVETTAPSSQVSVPESTSADPIVPSCDGNYAYDDELPISVCSYGESVRLLQEAVGLNADGYFGPATQHAISALQEGAGLPVTRRIDAATWAHLEVTASAPYPDLNGDGVIDFSEFPG